MRWKAEAGLFAVLLAVLPLGLGLVLAPVAAWSQEIPFQPSDYVVDLAGVMDSSTRAEVDGLLQELEQKTTAQVVVLTVNNLGGRTVEQFGLETANRWKLGQQGKDNGVLIVAAIQDRKARIEVGLGLESVLSKDRAGRILDEQFVPAARDLDYSAGLRQTALAVAWAVAENAGVALSVAAPVSAPASSPGKGLLRGMPDYVMWILLGALGMGGLTWFARRISSQTSGLGWSSRVAGKDRPWSRRRRRPRPPTRPSS